MKYPEGWAQQRLRHDASPSATRTTSSASSSATGAAPTSASVRADMASCKVRTSQSGPQTMTITGAPAVKVVYTTESAPNAVTGKRVTLVVDRYYLGQGGRRPSSISARRRESTTSTPTG